MKKIQKKQMFNNVCKSVIKRFDLNLHNLFVQLFTLFLLQYDINIQ